MFRLLQMHLSEKHGLKLKNKVIKTNLEMRKSIMKILFICTGNTCRSPMAEAIFKNFAKEKGLNIDIRSAGLMTSPNARTSKNTIAVLKEIGIDMESKEAHGILENREWSNTDIYVTMEDFQKEVLKRLSVPDEKIYVLGGGIKDPYGENIEAYRETREKILEGLKKMYKDIFVDGAFSNVMFVNDENY